MARRNRQRERERTERQRQKAVEDEKQYLKAKGIFFGLVFSDSLICVKVIESVEEMIEEGRMMHHCVGGYHNRENSLILSATIDGRRIETVEVSLKTFEVVQCRGSVSYTHLDVYKRQKQGRTCRLNLVSAS